jgi:hypothetical protein
MNSSASIPLANLSAANSFAFEITCSRDATFNKV